MRKTAVSETEAREPLPDLLDRAPFLPKFVVYCGSGDIDVPNTWQLWSYVQKIAQ